MLDRVTLTKVSGVCAILVAVTGIAGFVLFGVADGLTDGLDSDDAVDFLPAFDDEKVIVGVALWLFTLAPLLYLGAVLGIFQALRKAGDVMWIAVVASVVGAETLIASGIIGLAAVYEVATPYVDAGASSRADLAVLGDALFTGSLITELLGGVIVVGIGVLLFSLAILKTGFAPKWVAWLGFIAALLAWLGLLTPTWDVFEDISVIGTIVFFVWLAILGVVLLREQEQTVSAAPA